jgi:hypothetical protein
MRIVSSTPPDQVESRRLVEPLGALVLSVDLDEHLRGTMAPRPDQTCPEQPRPQTSAPEMHVNGKGQNLAVLGHRAPDHEARECVLDPRREGKDTE